MAIADFLDTGLPLMLKGGKMMIRGLLAMLNLTFLISSCGLLASPLPKSVNGSATELQDTASHKQLNAFFSEVAQADLGSFRNRPSDNEMIGFALVHILMKQPELLRRETGVSGSARIQPRAVEQVAEAFFGQHIRMNQTISSDFKFVNGSYLVSTREWEETLFAQVIRSMKSAHGRLTVDIAIFSAPASFSGDVDAPPATWSNLPSHPMLEKRMRAVVQRVDRSGTPHYVLVAYQKLVSP